MKHLLLLLSILIVAPVVGSELSDLNNFPLGAHFSTQHSDKIVTPEELDKISEESAQEVWGVNFEGRDLREVPPGLNRFKNLKYLSFAQNKITLSERDLEVLSECVTLKYLNLAANRIEHLSPKIEKLARNTNLIALNLCNNKINELPGQLYSLSGLHELLLANCQLRQLPDGISRLTNLVVLHLNFNPLETLPADFQQLHLKEVSALGCRFSEEIVEVLPNSLEVMLFGKNRFKTIPKSISKMEDLRELALNANNIAEISEEFAHLLKLERVGLNENNIKTIPRGLMRLNALVLLDLHDNPVTLPHEWLPWIKADKLWVDSDRIPK